MKKTGRKLFALLLALVLAVSMLSTSAFATTQSGADSNTNMNLSSNKVNVWINEAIDAVNKKLNDNGDYALLTHLDPENKYASEEDKELYVATIFVKDVNKMTLEAPDYKDGAIPDILYTLIYGIKQACNNDPSPTIDYLNPITADEVPDGNCVGPDVLPSGNCGEPQGNCTFGEKYSNALVLSELKGGEGAWDVDRSLLSVFARNLGLTTPRPVSLEEFLKKYFIFRVGTTSVGEADTLLYYAFKFVEAPKLELNEGAENESDSQIKIEEAEDGSKTVSGSDLRSGKVGSTVEAVEAKFKQEFGEDVDIKVFNGTTEINAGESVGTGYVVELLIDGNVLDKVTIVVPGDVSNGNEIQGDGEIDIFDCTCMLNDILGKKSLEGIYETAADIQADGTIDIYDITQVLYMILGKI